MQRLDINELKPSMVIATTIKDESGNIIFMKGTELTEKHLQLLKNRDIIKISVEGHPIDRGTGPAEALDKKIEERFSTAGTHPATLKIRDIIKEFLS